MNSKAWVGPMVFGIALIVGGCAASDQDMKKPGTPSVKAAADAETDKDEAADEKPTPVVDARPAGSSFLDLTQTECLSRIPSDASGGQRMLAEQACKQHRR